MFTLFGVWFSESTLLMNKTAVNPIRSGQIRLFFSSNPIGSGQIRLSLFVKSRSYRYGAIPQLTFWARGMDRHKKVALLAEAIYQGFVKDDGGEYLSKTGNPFPACNLRVHKTRKGFAVVRDALEASGERRIWTKKLLQNALGKMMKDKPLEVPQTPGFTWAEWLKDQVSRLHHLSQRARKNAWRMDQLQTLPYNPEDWVVSMSPFPRYDLHTYIYIHNIMF